MRFEARIPSWHGNLFIYLFINLLAQIKSHKKQQWS